MRTDWLTFSPESQSTAQEFPERFFCSSEIALMIEREQQINVGIREQLASAVAADCDQHERRRERRKILLSDFADERIDRKKCEPGKRRKGRESPRKAR